MTGPIGVVAETDAGDGLIAEYTEHFGYEANARASGTRDLDSVVEDEVALEPSAESALDLMRACSEDGGLFSGAIGIGPSWPACAASLRKLHPDGRVDYVPLIGLATYVPESGEQIIPEHSDELVEGGRIAGCVFHHLCRSIELRRCPQAPLASLRASIPSAGIPANRAAPNAHPLDCEGPAIGSSLVS